MCVSCRSVSPHKEMRFVLPLLPICMLHCGLLLREVFHFGRGVRVKLSCRGEGAVSIPDPAGKRRQRACSLSFNRVVVLLLFLSNALAVLYLGRWHQAAPVNALDYLAGVVEARTNGEERNSADTARLEFFCRFLSVFFVLHLAQL